MFRFGVTLIHTHMPGSPLSLAAAHAPVCTNPQLEIVPADPTAALRALVGQQKPAVGGAGATGGGGGAAASSGRSKSGGEGSAAPGDTAGKGARALAALPKGMRYSSPKAADKSRLANRRRLAASARAVASDRWAAQLGFRDGQEHIRELK